MKIIKILKAGNKAQRNINISLYEYYGVYLQNARSILEKIKAIELDRPRYQCTQNNSKGPKEMKIKGKLYIKIGNIKRKIDNEIRLLEEDSKEHLM